MSAIPSVSPIIQPPLVVDENEFLGYFEPFPAIYDAPESSAPAADSQAEQPPVVVDGKDEKSEKDEKSQAPPSAKSSTQTYFMSFTNKQGNECTYFYTDEDIKNGVVVVDPRRVIEKITLPDPKGRLTLINSTAISIKLYNDKNQFSEEDIQFITDHGHDFTTLEITKPRDAKESDLFAKISSFFPNLETLNLENCRFETSWLSDLKPLSHLKHLNLSCSGLKDHGLEALCSQHPLLESLDLSFCSKLTDAGFKHLVQLKNLKSLKLRDGAISPETIERLSQLQLLHIFEMKNFSDLHLQAVGTLSNLTSLQIAGCHRWGSCMTDAGVEHLAKLTKLTYLDISRNSFGDGALAHISKLTNLTSLDIEWSDFGNEGIKHLTTLVKLKNLFSRSCKYTDSALPVIGLFTHLEELYLTHHLNLNENSSLPLGNLTALKVLHIDTAKIEDAAFTIFAKFTKLRTLDLEFSTQYTAKGLLALKPLTELRELNCTNGEFDDEGLKIIAQFQKLENITLANCQKITEQGLSELAALPQLKKVNLRDCLIKNRDLVYKMFNADVHVDYR